VAFERPGLRLFGAPGSSKRCHRALAFTLPETLALGASGSPLFAAADGADAVAPGLLPERGRRLLFEPGKRLLADPDRKRLDEFAEGMAAHNLRAEVLNTSLAEVCGDGMAAQSLLAESLKACCRSLPEV